NNLLPEITIDELNNTLRLCPNNKAPGKSQIRYEDIKNLHPIILTHILYLYNQILKFQIFPSAWSQALIFPIPKPKAFNGLLNNTRPITLLETSRKLFVKILTSRLN
ncbi:hypothetical protein C1645_677424, partial [Glomus cerebriforme]